MWGNWLGRRYAPNDELRRVLTETIGSLPALQQVRAEARHQGYCAGANAENERIRTIEALALPGHEALIAQLKADPLITVDVAAKRIVQAEIERLSRANVVEFKGGSAS